MSIDSGKSSWLNSSETTSFSKASDLIDPSDIPESFKFSTSQDEQENHLESDEKKTKDVCSSPSRFLRTTNDKPTFVSDCNFASSSPIPSVKEQENFHLLSRHDEDYAYWQELNCENKNNQLLPEEKLQKHDNEEEQDEEEKGKEKEKQEEHQPLQQKHQQQSSLDFLSIPNQNFDSSDAPEPNNSFSSIYSLSDTITENNENHHQLPLLSSTPLISSFPSQHRPTTFDNGILSPSSNQNNNIKSLPLTLESSIDRSSTISTQALIADLQQKADVCQLNDMSLLSSSSSLRNFSHFPSSTKNISPYDQRISDQGNKYVIQLKTDEYHQSDFNISPRYATHQLVIDGTHREEDSSGGYIHRELHKIFNIPQHIDLSQFVHSYNKNTQELTIEMPYKKPSNEANRNDFSSTISSRNATEMSSFPYGTLDRRNVGPVSTSINTSGIGTETNDSAYSRTSNTTVTAPHDSSTIKKKPFDFDLFHRSIFQPQIVRTTSANDQHGKKLVMNLDLSDYQAEDIKVSVKDHELIVEAERKTEVGTRKSRTSFYQSTSLPPQANIEQLQSTFVDGKLTIEAPYIEQSNADRKVQTSQSINPTSHW